MDWTNDDFEKDLFSYSEIETLADHKTETVLPKTIQQYQKKIQSNNSASIFDADYSLDYTKPSELCQLGTQSNSKELEQFEEENVIYVVSGRGRGGRNMIIRPGEVNRIAELDTDEEVRRQIRKVSGLGYSNELIEASIKAQKMAKNSELNHLNGSSLAKIPESNGTNKSSPRSKTPASSHNPSPICYSGKSTPSTRISDKGSTSSDYLTPPDLNTSFSSCKDEENPGIIEAEEFQDAGSLSASSLPEAVDENKGAIPKRPLPLSQILRQSRDLHRKKRMEQKSILNNVDINQGFVIDFPTQRKIADILQQEEELWKKHVSYESSKDDILSWRRRNNSPPRFAWGAGWRKENKELDINSVDDFPALNVCADLPITYQEAVKTSESFIFGESVY